MTQSTINSNFGRSYTSNTVPKVLTISKIVYVMIETITRNKGEVLGQSGNKPHKRRLNEINLDTTIFINNITTEENPFL